VQGGGRLELPAYVANGLVGLASAKGTAAVWAPVPKVRIMLKACPRAAFSDKGMRFSEERWSDKNRTLY
jgi:hypothetical protein